MLGTGHAVQFATTLTGEGRDPSSSRDLSPAFDVDGDNKISDEGKLYSENRNINN